jgi:endonuclease/exonuclease/phosphatase family metal-dependent hydrolase
VLGVVSAFVYLAPPGCGSDTSSDLGGSGGASTGAGGTSGTGGSGGAAGLGASGRGSSSTVGSSTGVGGAAGSAQGGGGSAGGSPDASSDDGSVFDAADERALSDRTDTGLSDAKEGGAIDSSLPPGADLKIVTFNIRYANPADGVNAWPNRRDMVYRLLHRQDPDTFGVQEALFTQMQDLSTGMPEYHYVGVGRDDGVTAGEFSAIFYRTARFDVAESGTFWFSDTPEVPGSSSWGNASIRICTWGRFVEKGTGRSYYQFNVHLDNVSEPANEKSVQLLMQRVTQRKVQSDPFIVTGDFNSGESNPPARYMIGAITLGGMANPIPLVDSYRQLYPNATAVLTFHNFMGGTMGPKIDFIFMGPGEKAVTAEIDHTQENGRYPSDHYPVAAAIDILAWN